MEAEFPVLIGGPRRRVDLAIFASGETHAPENIQRVVVCRPELKQSKRGAVKMRDYEQAAKDIAEIEPLFEEIEACKYGLWTNGLELFFVRKKATKFEVNAEPLGDWPPADESIGERGVLSRARARRAEPEMLRTAFRRCHNFIHGNEGMPKDAAFWQFLYLIFCKMHDERAPRDRRRFWAGPQSAFAPRPNARPEAPNHPPHRLPTPVHEETSTLSALAHHHTPGESHQPSTRSG